MNESLEKKEGKKTKKKFSFKEYLKKFLIFIRDNLEKSFGILIVISLILIAILIKLFLGVEFEQTGIDKFNIFKEWYNNIKIIYIIVLAGIVPYIYAPVVGFFGFIFLDVANFVNTIKVYGYLKGIVISIVPLLINVIVISIATALGIYICRKITVGYKISNVKNMNFLNFRIRLYEAIGNDKKAKEYAKKKEEKITKLENKKEKLNYLQIGNTLVLIAILEFIAVVLKRILL